MSWDELEPSSEGLKSGERVSNLGRALGLGGRSAIWGGATLGVIVGLLAGVFTGSFGFWIPTAVIAGAAIGIVAEVLGAMSDRQRQRDFDEAIKLDPQLAEVYYNRGVAFYHGGLYKRAIQDYNEALRLGPQLHEAYYNRANAYCKLGQHEREIQDLDEAIRVNPLYGKAYYNRGMAYQALGKHKEAECDLKKAEQLGVG
jgi:tetratricopeptide (TPR) repeat protein